MRLPERKAKRFKAARYLLNPLHAPGRCSFGYRLKMGPFDRCTKCQKRAFQHFKTEETLLWAENDLGILLEN